MKKLIAGLLGAAAVTTTILLVRQQREIDQTKDVRLVHAGETQPATISIERMRELGL